MTAPQRVVVVGASGFGRECLDVLEAMMAAGSALEVLGVVDDRPSAVNLERLAVRGTPYLGTVSAWMDGGAGDGVYVLGIGDPRVRRALVSRLDEVGARALTAVHPTATIGSVADLGEGVVVCAGAAISTNVRLGRHVHVNPNATIGHDAVLDDFVSVNPGAIVSGEVTIGSETLVGAGATILQGLSVGQRTVLGAGTVATKDVPVDSVAMGVPARWSTT